jgi:hypothetical protein
MFNVVDFSHLVAFAAGDAGILNILTPLILVEDGFLPNFLTGLVDFVLVSIVMFVIGFGGFNSRLLELSLTFSFSSLNSFCTYLIFCFSSSFSRLISAFSS